MSAHSPNQIVFHRGEARVHADPFRDGKFQETEKVRVLGVGASLPDGMFARYTIQRGEDGGETITGVLQARAKGGRRYFNASNETDVQIRLLAWSKRILLERARDRS